MSAAVSPSFADSVMVCPYCHDWQLDVSRRVLSDMGGNNVAAKDVALAADQHQRNDCPGWPGRMKVHGQWIDPPLMANGQPCTGALVGVALPRWWVGK